MATILRAAVRNYCSKISSKGLEGPSAVSGGHEGGYKFWKKLSFFVAFPAIGLCMINCYMEHTKGHHERPPFIPYEHMRIRNKRFPWGEGQKSLFHNPRVNALPSGYEDEHEHED